MLEYEGEWKDGKSHGQGKEYTFTGELIYEGEYKDNIRHGQGKEYNLDGMLEYEGECIEGMRHGLGKLYSKTGTIKHCGIFYNGKYDANATRRWKLKRKREAEEAIKRRAIVEEVFQHILPTCLVCLKTVHPEDAIFMYSCGHRAICKTCKDNMEPSWKTQCMMCRQTGVHIMQQF